MLSRTRPVQEDRRDPRGVALIVTITILAVLTSLSATVVFVSVNNIQNTGRDRQATAALDLSEGGIAQGLEYLRSSGLAGITCRETRNPTTGAVTLSPECTSSTNPWSNSDPARSKVFTFGDNQRARVWISELQAPSPPSVRYGTYRVHAVGVSGRQARNSGGLREVQVTVQAQPVRFPLGVYADNVEGGGNARLQTESLFAASCVSGRNGLYRPEDEGKTDPAYGIPSGVHAVGYISEGQGGCGPTNVRNIHKPGLPCNPLYRGDQSQGGGPLNPADPSHAPCIHEGTRIPGSNPPAYTTKFTAADLARFDYRPLGLSPTEYASLKAKAIAQGNYFTRLDQPIAPTGIGIGNGRANAVVYVDLAGGPDEGKELSLRGADITQYKTETENPAPGATTGCGARSVVIIVRGGGLHLNSNIDMVGSVFVPEGNYRGNGGAQIWGTLFAKTIEPLNGTADFYMKQCFLNNLPGGLASVVPVTFEEIEDR